jgi:DNA-binding transcriptional regulator YiaG
MPTPAAVAPRLAPNDWRAIRLARGLSLPQVARSTGVSIGWLSLLERGLARMSPTVEVKLARYYFPSSDEARA